jgi:hypothetical protein
MHAEEHEKVSSSFPVACGFFQLVMSSEANCHAGFQMEAATGFCNGFN